jgi:hypothetical protein
MVLSPAGACISGPEFQAWIGQTRPVICELTADPTVQDASNRDSIRSLYNLLKRKNVVSVLVDLFHLKN